MKRRFVGESKKDLTSEQKGVLASAKEAGILSAFTKIVLKVHVGCIPRCIERFFLTFLKTSVEKSPPHSVVKHFPNGRDSLSLKVFSAQGIYMIVVNQKVRAFTPKRPKCEEGDGPYIICIEEMRGNSCLRKTRFGCVAGGGAFASAISVKSKGEFGLPSLLKD